MQSTGSVLLPRLLGFHFAHLQGVSSYGTRGVKLTLLITGDGQRLTPLTPAVAWFVRGEPPEPRGRGKPPSLDMSD